MTKTLSLAIILLAIATSPCSSAPSSRPPKIVSIGDLDLGSSAGQDILHSRLAAAARAVCSGSPDIRDLQAWYIYQKCYRDAFQRAVSSVASAQVADTGRHIGLDPH